jgi:hypothetical protein
VKQPAFEEGWAILRRGGTVAHWFQMGIRGRIFSLCRMARLENPKTILPCGDTRRCGVCLAVIARSGTFNPVVVRRAPTLEGDDLVQVLKLRFHRQIATFRTDPARGPRLYVCPTCRQFYEGRSDDPYRCRGPEDGEHAPVPVVELARKDPDPDQKQAETANGDGPRVPAPASPSA